MRSSWGWGGLVLKMEEYAGRAVYRSEAQLMVISEFWSGFWLRQLRHLNLFRAACTILPLLNLKRAIYWTSGFRQQRAKEEEKTTTATTTTTTNDNNKNTNSNEAKQN